MYLQVYKMQEIWRAISIRPSLVRLRVAQESRLSVTWEVETSLSWMVSPALDAVQCRYRRLFSSTLSWPWAPLRTLSVPPFQLSCTTK